MEIASICYSFPVSGICFDIDFNFTIMVLLHLNALNTVKNTLFRRKAEQFVENCGYMARKEQTCVCMHDTEKCNQIYNLFIFEVESGWWVKSVNVEGKVVEKTGIEVSDCLRSLCALMICNVFNKLWSLACQFIELYWQ